MSPNGLIFSWLGIRDDYRTLIGLDNNLEAIEGANDDEKLDSGDA